MIDTYLGTFKTTEELKTHNKQLKIAEYIKLNKMFHEHPNMEISSMMSDLALVLVNTFNMSWDEIEVLEVL